MATELEELIDFLSSPSLPVKRATVDIVRGLTGSEDELRSLDGYSSVLLPKLCDLLGCFRTCSTISSKLVAEVRHSREDGVDGMVKTCMDVLYKGGNGIERLMVLLLVNLTQLDAGVSSLLQVILFEQVGFILVNISKLGAGRKFLLDIRRRLLTQILRQFVT
ncbi:hypothetical protein AKJ16_DCAP20307 [Drosera capensis]